MIWRLQWVRSIVRIGNPTSYIKCNLNCNLKSIWICIFTCSCGFYFYHVFWWNLVLIFKWWTIFFSVWSSWPESRTIPIFGIARMRRGCTALHWKEWPSFWFVTFLHFWAIWARSWFVYLYVYKSCIFYLGKSRYRDNYQQRPIDHTNFCTYTL